jgi:hypothetical protein
LHAVSGLERIKVSMRKLRLILFVALACVPLLADDGGITWLSDYKEGIRLAKQTHQPMLVEFRCEA